MDEAQREITFEEWCAKLPDCHLVNRQLKEMKAAIEGALKIKDLWFPNVCDAKPEHMSELKALASMKANFEKIVQRNCHPDYVEHLPY